MGSLTYYVAASIDGYIAGPQGQVDVFCFEGDLAAWIVEEYPETLPVHARKALGINDSPHRHFDTVVMGRGTYEPGPAAGLPSPYPHLRQLVFSTTLTTPAADVEVVSRDPVAVVRDLKNGDGGRVWLAGGGRLAAALVTEIDELVIKRNPLLLGVGVPLVDGPFGLRTFERTGSRSFETGVVVESYRARVGR